LAGTRQREVACARSPARADDSWGGRSHSSSDRVRGPRLLRRHSDRPGLASRPFALIHSPADVAGAPVETHAWLRDRCDALECRSSDERGTAPWVARVGARDSGPAARIGRSTVLGRVPASWARAGVCHRRCEPHPAGIVAPWADRGATTANDDVGVLIAGTCDFVTGIQAPHQITSLRAAVAKKSSCKERITSFETCGECVPWRPARRPSARPRVAARA
jgi:hypothetical protein